MLPRIDVSRVTDLVTPGLPRSNRMCHAWVTEIHECRVTECVTPGLPGIGVYRVTE